MMDDNGSRRHKGGHHGKRIRGPIATLLAKTLGEDAVDDTAPREPELEGPTGSARMKPNQRAAMFERERTTNR